MSNNIDDENNTSCKYLIFPPYKLAFQIHILTVNTLLTTHGAYMNSAFLCLNCCSEIIVIITSASWQLSKPDILSMNLSDDFSNAKIALSASSNQNCRCKIPALSSDDLQLLPDYFNF